MPLLLVLLLIVLGAGAWIYSTSAPLVATPAPSAISRASAPTPAPGEVSVQVSEADLSEQINSGLAGRPLGETPLGTATASSFNAQLREGQVRVNASAQVGGASAPLAVLGSVVARDGKPVVEVSDAKLGGVPLPDASRRQMQQAIQARVDASIARRPMRVTAVTIADGQMTIIGAPGG